MRRRPRGAAVLVALALAGALCVRCQPAPELNMTGIAQRALLKQRDAITNWAAFAAANNISGWDEASDPCTWSGITCNATTGHVITVDLSCDYAPHLGALDYNVCAPPSAAGTFAPELANISSLKQIFIKGQNLSGTLPESWGNPGMFPNLESLPMENNSISGTLPAAWGQPGSFPKLWRLWLQDNELTGTVPPSWGLGGSFPSLTFLRLDNNSLSGPIPADWNDSSAFPAMKACTKGLGLAYINQRCRITLNSNPGLCGPIPAALQEEQVSTGESLVCASDEQELGAGLEGGRLNCTAGLPACAEAPPPAAPGLSPPPSPPSPSSSSSSSTNTGAIVGGVIAGIVVLGAAAFLAVWYSRSHRATGWRKEQLEGGEAAGADVERAAGQPHGTQQQQQQQGQGQQRELELGRAPSGVGDEVRLPPQLPAEDPQQLALGGAQAGGVDSPGRVASHRFARQG